MCRYLATLSKEQLTHYNFSDEARFDMNGEVNTQNVRRYAPKKQGEEGGKPEHFRTTKKKFPRSVMVFLGVNGNGKTFGLKMWEKESIKGGDYNKLVRFTCVPQIKNIAESDGRSLEDQYWQQDGATVHRTGKVLRYLDGQFGDRFLAWIPSVEETGLPGHLTSTHLITLCGGT